MATDHKNGILFKNSEAIPNRTRLIRSKIKEDAVNASTQIPEGGIIVVVSYSDVFYVKITDGAKPLSELKKLGEGEDAGSVSWNSITNKPAVIAEGANAAAARSAIGLGTAATQATSAFATASQGTKADSAVQPDAIANMVESKQESGAGGLVSNILTFTTSTDPATKLPGTVYLITED